MKGKKKKKNKAEEVEEELLDEEEGGKKGKKKKKKKILLLLPILLIVVAGAALFFLKGRGGGDDEEEKVKDDTVDPPQVYTFGETEILALPVFSEEVVVHKPEPPEPAEGEEAVTEVTYIYEGFTDARGLLNGYAGLLTAEDIGFVYVDDTLTRIDAPEFDEETGATILAKAGSEEGTVFSIQLEWTAEQGTVVTDTVEGRIKSPQANTMTLAEAEDFIRAMSPADLGLSGDSMAAYRIYPLAGSVLVDGRPCIHMSVYSVDETSGTNQIAGEFFIAADQSHIYKRDSANGRVYEVG